MATGAPPRTAIAALAAAQADLEGLTIEDVTQGVAGSALAAADGADSDDGDSVGRVYSDNDSDDGEPQPALAAVAAATAHKRLEPERTPDSDSVSAAARVLGASLAQGRAKVVRQRKPWEPPVMDMAGGGTAGDEEEGDGEDDGEEDGPSMYEQMMEAALEAKATDKQAAVAAKKGEKKFGSGVRKGFLSGWGGKDKPKGKAQPKGKAPARQRLDVPAKPAATGVAAAVSVKGRSGAGATAGSAAAGSGGGDGLVLDEVQQAMAASRSPLEERLAKKDWMNQALMAKIARDPRLMAGFNNPRCQEAIALMQRDAKAAKEKYKNDPMITDFLVRFTAMMGDHFRELGEKEAKEMAKADPEEVRRRGQEALRASNPEEVARMAEQGQLGQGDDEVKSVLGNRDVMKVLMDPEVQRVMEEGRQHPERLARHLRNPAIRRKLAVLQQAGLIRFE